MVGRSPHLVAGRLARRLAVALTVTVALIGACSQGDGSSLIDDLTTGGGTGDRPDQAPPAPQDVAEAFDGAIEATSEVRSTAITASVVVGTAATGYEGELAASGAGHVTAVDPEGAEFELRSDGETAWLRADHPRVTDELPDGVSWVAAPHDELVDTELVHELHETWEILPVLRGIESVEDLGVDDVAGVPVRMLRGDVDFAAALDAASTDERSGLEETIRLDGEVDQFVADVGLDGDGRVRSLRLDVEIGGGGGLGTSMTVVFEMRAFNQAVEVPDAPPADATVPLDDVPGLAGLLAASM